VTAFIAGLNEVRLFVVAAVAIERYRLQ